jgi:3-oxoacyl-[acyl-carrier protein] reductase
MNINLTGKRAFVCGASKGIGYATAVELADLGASVTVLARGEERLVHLCQQLRQDDGQKHNYLVVDLTQTDELKRTVNEHVCEKGAFHILVNNSGGPPSSLVSTAKVEDFLSAFSQHLIANHVMAQALIEGMKSEKFGRIINIISTSVKQPIQGLGVSNTVRSAVANWAKTLAGEVAKYGITVNNVLPGATETDRLAERVQLKSKMENQPVEAIIEHEKAFIPAGRFGKPEEVAQAVAFLASPAAAYINGINLPVDGGRTGCL